MLKAKTGQTCFFRMKKGDDLLETAKVTAEKAGIRTGIFTLIGALKNTVVGCYRGGEYVCTRLDGPLEIASCMGNIAVDEQGGIAVHAHLVVSNERGEAFGGHLMKGCLVDPTAELMIIEAADADLRRVFDEKTNLRLLSLG